MYMTGNLKIILWFLFTIVAKYDTDNSKGTSKFSRNGTPRGKKKIVFREDLISPILYFQIFRMNMIREFRFIIVQRNLRGLSASSKYFA